MDRPRYPNGYMMNRCREAWRSLAGLPPEEPAAVRVPSLESLRRSEWSPRFEKLVRDVLGTQWSRALERMMRDRLVMGAMRYGLLHARGKAQYDRTGSIVRRWGLYNKDGDLNWLADMANIALLEFEEGVPPCRPFDWVAESKPLFRRIPAYVGYYRWGRDHLGGDRLWLVGVAAACMLEFRYGKHPLRHLGTGDGDVHVSTLK